MDVGGVTLTPDGLAAVAAGFVVAGVLLGLLVAALAAMLDGVT